MNDHIIRQCLNKLYNTEKKLKRPSLDKWEIGFIDSILHTFRWTTRQRNRALKILSTKGNWIIPRDIPEWKMDKDGLF
jgi:hypothetical protein